MDYSFLRLKPTFNQAKQMFDRSVATQRYYDCIALHPSETYLQITGSDVNIVFANSYKASIIDCEENELKDITDNVTIYEGVDYRGVKQIAFEIVSIGQSWYGNPVFLKLESTIGDDVFYSNAFTVTDQNTQETIRLNYKSYGFYHGTDYKNFDYFQSIRVRAEATSTDDETENATYTQTNGNVLSQNPTIVFSENWVLPEVNNFTFRALAVALKSDIVYLDLARVTDRPQLTNGEVLGRSNLTNAELKIYRNLDDNFNDANQLTETFSITNKYPNKYLSLSIANTNKLYIDFNKNIQLGTTGFMNIYSVGGFLKSQLYVSDFDVVDNRLQTKLPLSNYVDDYANYYVTFTTNLVQSTANEDISLTDITNWTFQIGRGDFKDSDFKNSDFLIYT